MSINHDPWLFPTNKFAIKDLPYCRCWCHCFFFRKNMVCKKMTFWTLHFPRHLNEHGSSCDFHRIQLIWETWAIVGALEPQMSQAKAYMSIHESILWQVWVWKQGSPKAPNPKSHGLEMFRIMFPLKTFGADVRHFQTQPCLKHPTFCWLNLNFLCWNVATCHLNILIPS